MTRPELSPLSRLISANGWKIQRRQVEANELHCEAADSPRSRLRGPQRPLLSQVGASLQPAPQSVHLSTRRPPISSAESVFVRQLGDGSRARVGPRAHRFRGGVGSRKAVVCAEMSTWGRP